jgi:hypothetical protein
VTRPRTRGGTGRPSGAGREPDRTAVVGAGVPAGRVSWPSRRAQRGYVPLPIYLKVRPLMTGHSSVPRARVLSTAAAAVLALAATLSACGEESSTPQVSPQQRAANAAVRTDLKNLATFEEVFYVDHQSYTTDVAALARVGSIKVSEGATLELAVDDAGQRYCIRGSAGESSSAESTFTYASDGGGLSEPGPVRGWCAEAAAGDFARVAGSGVETYAPADGPAA